MKIKAKSAGAQIRRHNEKQLMEKISSQITEWGPEYLSKCKTIFVRAPKHQKHVMLQPLHQIVSDKLVIRPCPCPMHRPRFKEVLLKKVRSPVNSGNRIYGSFIFERTRVIKVSFRLSECFKKYFL